MAQGLLSWQEHDSGLTLTLHKGSREGLHCVWSVVKSPCSTTVFHSLSSLQSNWVRNGCIAPGLYSTDEPLDSIASKILASK